MDGSCVQFKDPLLVVLIKIQPSGDHQQLYCRSVEDPNRSTKQSSAEGSRVTSSCFFNIFFYFLMSFKEKKNYIAKLQSRHSVTRHHGVMGQNIF